MLKDTNVKDLTKDKGIRKGWQEQRRTIQKKKGLNDLDSHNVVVTHLEPDILECEVKWALGSITGKKASED